MKRLFKAIDNNGVWGVYIFFSLLRNYIRVYWIRKLLQVPDIYFQGAPKIINRKSIFFGRNFQCGKGAWIESVRNAVDGAENSPKIKIGDNFTASEYLHIGSAYSVLIGEIVLIGSHLLITDHGHGSYGSNGSHPDVAPNSRPLSVRGPVVIGTNVWLCDGVKILSGVTIGNGVVVAANCVVRENIPDNSIYDGRVVKRYNQIDKKWSIDE